MSAIRMLAFATLAAGCALMPQGANAGSLTTLYAFKAKTDGSSPQDLLFRGGSLYGATLLGGSGGYGTVFKLNPSTGALSVIYSFGESAGGAVPTSLFYIGGTLYGTTQSGGNLNCDEGGTTGCGTIFAIDPATGAETVLYTFTGSPGGVDPYGVINDNGTLYGATGTDFGQYLDGTVFSFNIASSNFTTLYQATHSGWSVGGLLAAKHDLYGTVNVRARARHGAIYKFKHGGASALYKFKGMPDGTAPGALLDSDGTTYGVTSYGGASNDGTVFTFDPTTKTETVLYSFTANTDGKAPVTVVDVSGTLYGITAEGGNSSCSQGEGCGILFELDPATGTETILYSFSGGADGGNPDSLIYQNGTFYGATTYGGRGAGTVFQYTP
jgi:uncharacterized repeat protein (TIGR03803 family)